MLSSSEKALEKRYESLGDALARRGVDIENVKEQVKRFEVEVPSWVFGAFGGGRFGEYLPPAPARDSRAKIRDAAMVHKLTGAAPGVAIHVGWDKPEDVAFDDIVPDHFASLRDYALEQGVDLGAVNPTLFLKGTQHGSLGSPVPQVRHSLIRHCKVCCEIADTYSQGIVSYWLPDGSCYPGQVDLWGQERLVREALKEIYVASPPGVTHLIEYKLFEPGTYSTVIADAGIADDIARSLGERAGVLVDMGHHAHGVNVPQIVARLIAAGRPAGFHFNSRYAADDDHAVEPNITMYAVFCELVKGNVIFNERPEKNWSYVIDQSSSLENRIPAVLHSIDSLQISLARALTLDWPLLQEMQSRQEIMAANRVFLDAFLRDVRPIVQTARVEQGLPPDPVVGYDQSGYQQKIEAERA